MHSIDNIIDKIPNKWENVQSIHLKTPDSAALPIYNCVFEECSNE